MGNLGVYLVFLFGGAILANFASVAKFSLLAVILTVVYFIYHLIAAAQFGGSAMGAISAFVLMQIGYVSGLALKIAYANFFPKGALPSRYGAVIEEKTRIK